MANSSTVSTGNDATAAQYNNLRSDVLDTSTGHVHDGTNGRSLIVELDTSNVSNPPTDAQLDTAFGTPATVGGGFLALLDDNGDGSNFYIVASDGTNWWHAAMTKAT